jgi:membrane-associated phospholipid phosphatase
MRKVYAFIAICIFCFTTFANAKVNHAFVKFGDWGQVILPISAAYIGYVKENNYEGVKQLAKTYASTMLVSYALKYSIRAERPNGGRYSFPSGHSSSAFAGASFLAFRYGYKYGIPAYIGAIAVGASRIHGKHHHLADVVASATISIFSAHIFTTRYKETIKLTTSPVNGGGQLLNLEVVF